jgi:hypothetical protein
MNPWGVEQCAHAFLLMDNSNRLNNDQYFAVQESTVPEEPLKKARMIHFIGKLHNKQYLKLGKQIIKELKCLKN